MQIWAWAALADELKNVWLIVEPAEDAHCSEGRAGDFHIELIVDELAAVAVGANVIRGILEAFLCLVLV